MIYNGLSASTPIRGNLGAQHCQKSPVRVIMGTKTEVQVPNPGGVRVVAGMKLKVEEEIIA